MSVEIVNPVPHDEFDGWTQTLLTTFLVPPDPEQAARYADGWRDRLDPARTWGARDRGRWVATLATETRVVTVPDGRGGTRDLPADALTAVTTAATHRRQGLLRAMITDAARDARERGLAVSVLVAAEWPIYGRYGYGPAVPVADYEYAPRGRAASITSVPGGTVRTADREELVEVAPPLFDAHRRRRAGQVDRPPFYWRRVLDEKPVDVRYNAIVHETHGVVDGMLTWRPDGDWDITNAFARARVVDVVTGTAAAYRNLWAYLAGLDVVETVILRGRPVDEPARWLLTDGRALHQTYAGDFVWVRFLDVCAALSARGYAVPGRLVLDLLDDGVVLLEGGPDGATCTPTTLSPDLRLPARVLASAYLGGYRLAPLAFAGNVEEVTSGSLARLDAMFATPLAPFCQTGF